MTNDPLFSPFTIKNLTLKNRIVSTSHEPAYSEDGLPKDRYRAYHVEKAKGGVGLTMTAGSALVSRSSAPAFGNLQIWKDESVPWLRRLTDEVHDYGTAVMIQLTHLGHRTSNYTDEWLPAVSVSAIREPAHRAFAKAAEDWDLDRIEKEYVEAAQRCVAGGMDGIEIMLNGHLLDSFITPYWNHREDEYGGSYENRMRFPLRIIRAVKAAVPDDFILATRMSFDDRRPDSPSLEELIQVAHDAVGAGIDFINALVGSIDSDARLAHMIPVMGMPSAPHLEFVGGVKQKLNVPVMHAAKIADVPTARYAIEAGLLDLVGMTRAILADPYLPQKIRENREDEIRPCVGASMCIDGIYTNGAAYCIHNPSSGRELELPQTISPASGKKRVAVVGGGPAGLEAARVLGERGHEVTLFEASDKLGGQLNLAVLAPRRRDLQGIIDWRAQELNRLGVTVKLNSYAEASDVAGFDVVVVATGGLPHSLEIQGGQFAIDSWDFISGAKRVSGKVLVFDDNGSNQALDVVEAALRAGASVELVTPERNIAPEVGGLVASRYFEAITEANVRITPLRYIREIERNGSGLKVSLGLQDGDWRETREVDFVISELGTFAVADLYEELVPGSSNGGAIDIDDFLGLKPQTTVRNADGKYQVFRIGDAVAGRNVHAAMLDAARLCHAI